MDSLYSTDVVGTIGYLAPEYAESGKMSTKTDVYSFGVVLLQLITGMRTCCIYVSAGGQCLNSYTGRKHMQCCTKRLLSSTVRFIL